MLEGAFQCVAAERLLEGQVLIRVSRLDSVLHWQVERVASDLGQTAPLVAPAVAAPISG